MKLTKLERKLLLKFKDVDFIEFEKSGFSQSEFNMASLGLKEKGYCGTQESNEEGCFLTFITDKGKVFLASNSKARNTFLTKTSMWIIGLLVTIAIAVVGLMLR